MCIIIIWHSHLNDIEIPETKRFIPKGFELVTTLSKPNRPVSQIIRDAIGLLVSVKPSPIPRRSLLPRCPREVWKQPVLTEPRTPRDNAELSRNFMGYVKSVNAIGALDMYFVTVIRIVYFQSNCGLSSDFIVVSVYTLLR